MNIVVRSRYLSNLTFLYGIRQTGMAMLEFTHCISQYYPNIEGKYVQKQKQTLLLLFYIYSTGLLNLLISTCLSAF